MHSAPRERGGVCEEEAAVIAPAMRLEGPEWLRLRALTLTRLAGDDPPQTTSRAST